MAWTSRVVATACAVFAVGTGWCRADVWPSKQRDPGNTGRSDFVVPLNRQGSNFFDIYLWQTPLPGSPLDGSPGASAVSFFDGAGPAGEDVAVVGYHWPKGVIGLDRHTGRVLWSGNPSGGETIGDSTPAFSPDGSTVYVVNDATESKEFPAGHPFMAFAAATGPETYRHNGLDANPWHLAIHSPKVWSDGRIFLHSWVDRPRGATDSGTALFEIWNASTPADQGLGDVALYSGPSGLRVIVGSRSGALKGYSGSTGAQVWSTPFPMTVDSTPTVDPATGNVYVSAGAGDVAIVGLTRDGVPLWGGTPAHAVFTYVPGKNNPQRAQAAGCLSHNGATFYFQTNSDSGDGVLYAINTADGTVKWTYASNSRGWEMISSSPIVTPNGVIVVGNNQGGAYLALRDDGSHATLLDTLVLDAGGEARSTATLAADGTLYLPLHTVWTTASEGSPAPTFSTANLVGAIDLRHDAHAVLAPPGRQRARVLNAAVELRWVPVPDPTGALDHYAIYRATAPFTSVEGMTAIASVPDPGAIGYVDHTASNGTSYYYAVTSVSTTAGESTTVASVGPRTPFDETDLQVACVSRTPRFPRYDPQYTGYEITEPGGFGPYFFSAATGLGSGQTGETPRWPDQGRPVTYTATVRNRGTNTWPGPTMVRWSVNDTVVVEESLVGALAPGQTTTSSFQRAWDQAANDRLKFEIVSPDARATNNTLELTTKSVAYLSYVDQTYLEEFRELTAGYPESATDDLIDWLNRHMARFNDMFSDAGTPKRVHFDVLTVLDDVDEDPDSPPTLDFAIFPFRYRAGDGTIRLSGYYDPGEDLDYGLLHEMGHQLGLIDLYRLDLGPDQNLVTATGYSTAPCLMNGVSHFVSQGSAAAMTRWFDTAHGYFGQYLYQLPDQVRLRLLGFDGAPIAKATVRIYQKCERPGVGEVITPQVKFTLTTDDQGYCTLPNVPVDAGLVPPTFAGDVLHDNPFGYVAVVGSNGLLLIEADVDGFRDYAWLDIVEVNDAFTSGQTGVATFMRQLALGGPVQAHPPSDMSERNASSWSRWSQDGEISLADDSARRHYRAASIRLQTTGGFDNLVRYPADRQALWDVSGSTSLRAWFYAENPNDFGFQNGSPWVRLLGRSGYIELHPTFDVLNTAINRWQEFVIPLAGDGVWHRADHGEVSLTEIIGVEIHADTWGAGFTLWIDGVRFDPTPCPSDWNQDGVSNSTDVSDFINSWFEDQAHATLSADWDDNGVANSTDVSDFINAWFEDASAGCG
jgi:hypothetical protein